MLKWIVLSMVILAVFLFLSSGHNRSGVWKLIKRFWMPVIGTALVVAVLVTYSQANL